MKASIYLTGVIVSLFFAYGAFRLYRWFNWNFSYESLVKSTIVDMVKTECLRNDGIK